jgi:hypothetical protein
MNARKLVVLAAVVASTPSLASAQLPAAKDLIQKWSTAVNASGWKGHKSARTTAAFDIPAMGLSAKMEAAQMFSPAMSVSKVDIPGMGGS